MFYKKEHRLHYSIYIRLNLWHFLNYKCKCAPGFFHRVGDDWFLKQLAATWNKKDRDNCWDEHHISAQSIEFQFKYFSSEESTGVKSQNYNVSRARDTILCTHTWIKNSAKFTLRYLRVIRVVACTISSFFINNVYHLSPREHYPLLLYTHRFYC